MLARYDQICCASCSRGEPQQLAWRGRSLVAVAQGRTWSDGTALGVSLALYQRVGRQIQREWMRHVPPGR